jgi:uncharacterized protein YraI
MQTKAMISLAALMVAAASSYAAATIAAAVAPLNIRSGPGSDCSDCIGAINRCGRAALWHDIATAGLVIGGLLTTLATIGVLH